MDLFYTLYMAEAEGLLPTRAGRINAAIADIKADPRPTLSMDEFEEILDKHDLTYNSLSKRELNHINTAIR